MFEIIDPRTVEDLAIIGGLPPDGSPLVQRIQPSLTEIFHDEFDGLNALASVVRAFPTAVPGRDVGQGVADACNTEGLPAQEQSRVRGFAGGSARSIRTSIARHVHGAAKDRTHQTRADWGVARFTLEQRDESCVLHELCPTKGVENHGDHRPISGHSILNFHRRQSPDEIGVGEFVTYSFQFGAGRRITRVILGRPIRQEGAEDRVKTKQFVTSPKIYLSNFVSCVMMIIDTEVYNACTKIIKRGNGS